MTADERDRLIEDALRVGPNDAAAPGPFCLDAETAAAWVDGSLGAEELDVARTHAADCARCQMLMAVLMAAEPPSAAAEADPIRTAHSIWQRWTVWAAPLATAALLLVAVIVWTRTPNVPERTGDARQRAPAAAATPEVSPGTPPAPAPSTATAASPADVPAMARRPRAAALQGAPAPSASVPQVSAPLVRAEAGSRDAPARAEERLSKSAAPAAAPAAPATPPPSVSADATGVPLFASRPQALNETIIVASVIVVSTDPSVRWRISGAALARSVDGGATWTQVDVPGGSTLTAGSAPSSTVCWIVGRGGVVLRTVDGTTWRPTAIPAVVDLTAIVAADARSATVTAADGRRFDTRDGGASWTPTEAPTPR